MAVLTTEWENIQQRSIDPFANVDSDIANNLHLCFGSSKMYFTGFNLINFEMDNATNMVVGSFSAGTAIMDNVSIKITNSFTIPLFTFPNPVSITRYIVLRYQYIKTSPAPVASINVVTDTNLNTDTDLILYQFITGAWNTIIDIETWNAWLENDSQNWVDNRFNSGIIFRTGDTMSGNLNLLLDPTAKTHAANKKYVDEAVSGVSDSSQIIKTTGGILSGPITWNNTRTPTSENELVTKGYTDNNFLKLSGGSVIGATEFLSDIIVPYPTQSNSAVNVDYIDTILGNINEGIYIRKTGGDATGAISMPTEVITSSFHLVNVAYVNQRYMKYSGGTLTGALHSNIDYVEDNSCLINKEFADTNYMKYTGGQFTGAITLSNDNLITSNASFITKGYADIKYLLLTGGTLTGALKLPNATITEDTCVLNRSYADARYVAKNAADPYWNNASTSVTLAATGSVALPNGFKMKWGNVTIPSATVDGWTTVTFATAFASNCFSVVFSCVSRPDTKYPKSASVTVSSATQTEFTFTVANGWTSNVTDVDVFKNGLLKNLTSDYTIDFATKKITFVSNCVANDVVSVAFKSNVGNSYNPIFRNLTKTSFEINVGAVGTNVVVYFQAIGN